MRPPALPNPARRRSPWLWVAAGCGCLFALPLAGMMVMGLGLLRGMTGGPAPTVPGPEASDLLPKLKGTIVLNPPGQVEAIQLPSLKQRILATASPSTNTVFPSIHTVSAPDAAGKVIYVENRMSSPTPSTHALMLADGKSPPRTFFTRLGDALWDHVIGEHLALSPDGKRAAYVRDAKGTQFPGAYLQQGAIEILDVKSGAVKTTQVVALDQGVCWFPDGRRLAFVAPVRQSTAPPISPGKDGFGDCFAGWDPVPVVCVLDTATGKVSNLHVGWSPCVSTDGKQVVVSDMATPSGDHYATRLRLVDAASGASQSISLPGLIGDVIALWPGGLALYWGLPTSGSAIGYTKFNSPLSGPKLELTLKAGVINSSRFQTVVPVIDPRTKAVWGPAK